MYEYGKEVFSVARLSRKGGIIWMLSQANWYFPHPCIKDLIRCLLRTRMQRNGSSVLFIIRGGV